ncbi:hypothetical protein ACQP0U_20065 [Micromonospora sp. CA-269861]|uniref:hypothetical protein n=1 Tax=Micromonospora sp. CA-269861 TaxID=3239968 RepID=UPI003D8E0D13
MSDEVNPATTDADSAEARRVRDLVGRRLPEVVLTGADGQSVAVAAPGAWSVLYLFPGAYAPGLNTYPAGWADIPGARGCTLESATYADRYPKFRDAGARVRGCGG